MIKVIGKALNIIEILSRNPEKEFSLTEIAQELEMDRGTCSNILKSLLERGYVQHSAPGYGYKFGYMFYKLTDNPVNNEILTIVANEDVITLGEQLNERVVLTTIKNDKRIFLMTTTPNRNPLIKTNIDKSVYVSSTGRVIIANYSPKLQQRFISRAGLPTEDEWPEIYTSLHPDKELSNRLSEIRMLGYDVLVGKNGLTGIACPLFKDGQVVGSLGVLLPQERMNDNILFSVRSSARTISSKLSVESPFLQCKNRGDFKDAY